MSTPLRIVVLFHPSSDMARQLAEHVHRAFSARPSGYGARIPVRFGPAHADGRPADGLDLDDAQHTLVVVLADRRMVTRAPDPTVGEAWEQRVLELLEQCEGSSRHSVVPVALDDRAFRLSTSLSQTSFVRLDFRSGQVRQRHLLTHVATRGLRLLLGRSNESDQDADSVPPAPLSIFLSHAKADLTHQAGRQTHGPVPTLLTRLAECPVEGWYDASKIEPGDLFGKEIEDGVATSTALVAVVGDAWSSREWCRAEALLAKFHRRPLVVVDALERRTDRLFPYVANAIAIRWRAATTLVPGDNDPDQVRLWWERRARQLEEEDADEVILTTLIEALRHEHELQRLAEHHGPGTAVLGSPPEALTLDQLGSDVHTIWYPDPPLGREELEHLQKARPDVTFHTPLSELARWERPAEVDGVAVSLSGSPDAQRYGGSPAHLTQLAEDLSLYLLLAGIRIFYGGMIGHGGSQPGDAENYTTRLFDLVYTYAPLAAELQSSRFHPIVNMVPWPIHLGYGDDEHDLYGREAELVAMPRPAALTLGDDVLQPLPNGFVIPKSPEQRFAWTLALTEMRRKQVKRTAARVVLGGKIAGAKSRYPGVLEEALESLRGGQPTYLLGAFGGAARLTIDALQGRDRPELTTAWFQEHDEQWLDLVRLYNQHGIDLDTPEQLAAELAELGRPGPAAALDNGLSDAENRELFVCDDPQRAVGLILKGLRARYQS